LHGPESEITNFLFWRVSKALKELHLKNIVVFFFDLCVFLSAIFAIKSFLKVTTLLRTGKKKPLIAKIAKNTQRSQSKPDFGERSTA
jgi:hypothetical protein